MPLRLRNDLMRLLIVRSARRMVIHGAVFGVVVMLFASVASADDGRTEGRQAEFVGRIEHAPDGGYAELAPVVIPLPPTDLACVDHAPRPGDFIAEVSPLEREMFEDAADGRWDSHTLIAAALIAGGVKTRDDLARYEETLGRLHEAICEQSASQEGEIETARRVLEHLHRAVLTGGYRLDCSSVAMALDEGKFNCVTASVLFNELATRSGLEVVGLETPGHAMSRLYFGDETLDVETTCASWFHLLDDPARMAASIRAVTSQAVDPADNAGAESQNATAAVGGLVSSGDRREVTSVELVATIYYNRGVDLLTRERFAEAASANAKALLLDPRSVTAWGNLMATINNWAIFLGSREQFAEAIELLDRGVAMDPDYPTFHPNHLHIYHRWARTLSSAGRFEEALAVLDRARAALPDEEKLQRIRSEIVRERARYLLERGEPEAAFRLLDAAEAVATDQVSASALEVVETDRAIRACVARGRFDEALTLIDAALARHPKSAVLRERKHTTILAWAEEAFDRGDFAEAIRRIKRDGPAGRLDDAFVETICESYRLWIARLLASGGRAEVSRLVRQARRDPYVRGRIDRTAFAGTP